MKPYPVWVEQIQDKDKADEQDCIVYGVAAKPDGWLLLRFHTYLILRWTSRVWKIDKLFPKFIIQA